ncbi:IS200/IS605 family transposase [Catellatospora aurea]|uniref:IS200/IS605 family transposase n=1 Tax=Catellatospora aurea TaxID=1337874 RepID=A0ABW2H3M9_9ACTN
MTTRRVRKFAGGVYDLGLHVVWCSKYRRPVLTGDVAARCDELVRGVCGERGWDVVALEVMSDFVHLVVRPDPKSAPSLVASQVKSRTSRVLRHEFSHLRSKLPTLWSSSYFVGSVGVVSGETVQRYIQTQYERPWRRTSERLPSGPADLAIG